MNSFEEHARRAAADASESVDGINVPDLRGGPSAGARMALAAAAVIVAVLAGFALLRGEDADTADVSTDESTPVTAPEEDPPAEVPAGEGPAYFTFPPEPGASIQAWTNPGVELDLSVTFYGRATEIDPIGDGFLLAAALDATTTDERLDEGERFTVRGVDAVQIDDDFGAGTVGIEWFEPSGANVQLASDVLDLEELIVLAETLEIDGTTIAIPSPPGGMTRLLGSASSRDLPLPNAGWSLTSSDNAGGFTVLTGAESVEHGLVFLRVLLELHEPVAVRGTTGWTSSTTDFPAIIWAEAGSVLMLGDDTGGDLVALAEALIPISEQEFAELVGGPADPAEAFPEDDSSGPGQESLEPIAEGTIQREGETLRWTHYVSSAGDRCFDLEDSEGLSGQCAGDASVPASARFRLLPWWPYSLDGMVSDEVASIVLYTDSNIGGIPLTSLAGGGQAFLRFLEQDEQPWLLEAYDAANDLLWQVPLPNEPRWTYDRGGDTRFGPITSVLDVSYELIGGALTEQRLFVTELGTVCHEYISGDVQSDCPGSDSPFAIGGVQSDTMELTPIRIEGVTSASGRVSSEVDRVEVITDRRVYHPLLHELADSSVFATMLDVGEHLISVSAYGADGGRIAHWEPAPPPSYPTTAREPDTTYPTVGG